MKFRKMNGVGNDFIIINNIEERLPLSAFPMLAEKLCDRRMSIGADGLMAVEKSDKADFKMLFYNSDGTMGEMCGNGARCICRYGYENSLCGEKQTIETTAGIVTGERLSKRVYKIRLNDPSVIKRDMKLEALGKTYSVSYVELGRPGIPHAVVEMPNLGGMTFDDLRPLGRALRYHGEFPKGANVNFIEINEDGSVTEATYERGVEDFTLACGTGTGSSAVILTLGGKVSGKSVRFHVPGGELTADVELENGKVKNLYLIGTTNTVCKGEVTDEELCIHQNAEK